MHAVFGLVLGRVFELPAGGRARSKVTHADLNHLGPDSTKARSMTSEALFALSVLMSLVAFGIVTRLYIWPRLRLMTREDALMALVAPHMFRFIGLSFLVPGVVAPSLPSAFTAPAAYGDLVASVLAIIATLALATRAVWAIPIVWLFDLWGGGDLLHAVYQGQIGVGIGPGSLGAAFYIPTVIVPPLLVTHALIFWILLRPNPA